MRTGARAELQGQLQVPLSAGLKGAWDPGSHPRVVQLPPRLPLKPRWNPAGLTGLHFKGPGTLGFPATVGPRAPEHWRGTPAGRGQQPWEMGFPGWWETSWASDVPPNQRVLLEAPRPQRDAILGEVPRPADLPPPSFLPSLAHSSTGQSSPSQGPPPDACDHLNGGAWSLLDMCELVCVCVVRTTTWQVVTLNCGPGWHQGPRPTSTPKTDGEDRGARADYRGLCLPPSQCSCRPSVDSPAFIQWNWFTFQYEKSSLCAFLKPKWFQWHWGNFCQTPGEPQSKQPSPRTPGCDVGEEGSVCSLHRDQDEEQTCCRHLPGAGTVRVPFPFPSNSAKDTRF